jgi:glycosyltransferase involved in cell wall biosynthesis
VKVLHVSDCYAPRVGGIEIQVSGLAAAQARAGHEVDVVTRTRQVDVTSGGAVRVHRLGTPSAPGFAALVGSGRHLDAIMRAARPDVVHVHTSLVSPLAVTAAVAAVRAGRPTVVTVHSMWGPYVQTAYRTADRIAGWSRWPVVWTTVSEAGAAAMRPLLPTGPSVVPNAIDLPFWHAVEPTRAAGPGLHVAAVGRLAPRKRAMDVVRVLRDTRRRLPVAMPLQATVVGDGPERAGMTAFLARHRMRSWVTLTGGLGPADVRRALADADVFLAPATLESFGIAALEARTVGLPVVARAGTGVADFVAHGREGLLAADRDGLTDALVRLACEPGLRQAMAAHNRAAVASRFGWAAVVAQFEACYERARTVVGRPALTPGRASAAAPSTPPPPALPGRSRRRG